MKLFRAVLIPFMSGKIGYLIWSLMFRILQCLNPFYVREDWLHWLQRRKRRSNLS